MVKKKRAGARSTVDEQLPFNIRRTALSLAVAAALPGAMAMPSVALAQDDDEEPVEIIEEVVSYGSFSESIANSIATKRDNSSIVEAISAEDLGKLPDVSIAESLARLPGLTVQRLNGRGQVVNIRGMSPDFSTGILNGREQVSVGDNRGVEFDQYPSELLQRVLVYKTPDAALIGQGLAGTVDMRTVRPLEYAESAWTVNGRIEQTEYDLVTTQDDTGERFSSTYINQFANDTVGVMVGVSHATTPSFGRNNNAWGYYVGDGEGNVAIGGGRVWARASELERNSLVGALDLRPNDQMEITFDAFLSTFEEDQIKHGLVMNLDGGAMTAFETHNGLVTRGEFAGNTRIGTENNVFLRDADLQSFGANLEFDFLNGWVFTGDLSHSSIDRSDTAEFESNGGLGGAGGLTDVVGFETGEDGTVFSVGRDYSNVDYSTTDAFYATSPFGWGDPNALAPFQPAGQFGYNKVFDVEDDINAFRAEMAREMDWKGITQVEIGYNFANREKSRQANEGVITSGVIDSGTGDLATAVEVPQGIAGSADLSGWGLSGANTSIIAYNPYDLLASGQIQQGDYLYDDILEKSWVSEEDVNTMYVKFDFDTEFLGLPLSGNFGIAHQWWDQASSGQNASGSGAGLVVGSFSDDFSDDETLPSLNATWELTDNLKVRFGAARTLARPRMDDINASGFYSYNATNAVASDDGMGNVTYFQQADVDQIIAAGLSPVDAYSLVSPWSRSGGNIALRPWIADSYDLSFEYYFEGSASYMSFAVFQKDLKSYIFDQQLLFDFSGLPGDLGLTDITTGVTTSAQNGEGGEINGWELSATLGGDLIDPALEGFGIVTTYSYNDSEIEPNGPGSQSDLPGLSKDIWSVTGFYERNGFSARINQRYRSGYVGEVAGFGGARSGTDLDEETVVDAQISYEFQNGALEGLSILFLGQNLTDEPFRRIDPGTGIPTEFQTFGSTYSIGFNYPIYK